VIDTKIEPLAQYYEDSLSRCDLDKARFTPIEAYAKSLRDSVRALWQGRVDRSGFGAAMFSAIDRHLEIAWRAGAAECGIRPDERTEEEQSALEKFIDNQIEFVPRFGRFIEENSKAEGGLLRTSLKRLPPWVNRWNEVKSIATQMACGDLKQMWVLGQAEHCKTCLKLSGRVMRGSRWAELDIYPQDTRRGKLQCRGFNCKCRFVKTNKRATPGRLPRLP
jgi:hypothetical protein